jgi:class 3 adenylate cyclase/CHASE2 domain-containing sensor protein
MRGRPTSLVPLLITVLAVAFASGLHVVSRKLAERPPDRKEQRMEIGLAEQLEAMTYDARVKLAAEYSDLSQVGRNMATLFFDDQTVRQVNDGTFTYYYAPATNQESADALTGLVWPWPRFIHGQIVRELAAEGARAIGFDIIFPERLPGQSMTLTNGEVVSSDEFFAREMGRARNVFLGVVDQDTVPAIPFQTNAAGLASINSHSDFSVLRRVKPFEYVRVWHPLLRSQVKALNLDLANAKRIARKIIIPTFENDKAPMEVPLNENGTMKLTKDGDIDVSDDPQDEGPMTEFPYVDTRVWNLGVRLAAQALGLDLQHPVFQPGKLILRGTNDVVRTIPLDTAGYFNIDWSIRLSDLKNNRTPIYFGRFPQVLAEDKLRAQGEPPDRNPFKNKIVLIGSIASGNNMTDLGATPLESRTPLVTKHLNIANSILTGRFVERTSLPIEVLMIIVLGLISAVITWQSRVLVASIAVCGLSVAYIAFTVWMYLDHRYWIPMAMPVGGGLILPHFGLISYRVIFEQREQRRVRGIFSKIVSPDVVQELLNADRLAALSGARRTITVFFADVRGFTEFTDSTQQAAEEYVRQNNLSAEQTRVYYDKIAAEQLQTVNLYLATIADTIKQHRGTLDKYMGDCVMAFWGSPTPNERHALDCVNAAINAQRAMNALNQEREKENERRKQENIARQQRGEAPLPPMPVLALGTGINTGSATVGLMGSDATILNYTVFGREVNLASRLEGASGRGRILISEATLQELRRLDPALAATCIPHPAITPKGFRQPIPIYEVPWKMAVASAEKTKLIAREKAPAT